jgi:serine-type D-Ala-D-Ala carboxypeptidase/endopeptidase
VQVPEEDRAMGEDAVPPPPLSEAKIKTILDHRISSCRLSPGYAVGMTEETHHRLLCRGSADPAAGRELRRDALFEIGSVTKLFTLLLLADMAHRRDVSLDDPVADLLPPGVSVPEYAGKPITLLDLASHTAGLPHRPTNLVSPDPVRRYAGYSPELLYAFLASYTLPRPIGATFEYSNVGFGLLGHALALRAGTDYESLIKTRIAGPLGLADTMVNTPPEHAARRATGHDESLDPLPYTDLGVLVAAGGLRSTLSDLLTFLDALDVDTSPLVDPVRILRAPRESGGLGAEQANADGYAVVEHKGLVGGFHSYVGTVPKWRRGVVVLANANVAPVADLGHHLLDTRCALHWHRPEASVQSAGLERLVGCYRIRPSLNLTVTREGDRLYVQATDRPRRRLFAASALHYFSKSVAAEIIFEGSGGTVDRLILHQSEMYRIAERVR